MSAPGSPKEGSKETLNTIALSVLSERNSRDLIACELKDLVRRSKVVTQLRRVKDALREAQRENLQIDLERNQY